MNLNTDQLDKLKLALINKKKELEKMIESVDAEDPFKDPEAGNRSPSTDTDIREEQGYLNIQAQLKELKSQLKEVDDALDKTVSGKYGNCENCGNTIPENRLNLIPWARYCIECDKKMVK